MPRPRPVMEKRCPDCDEIKSLVNFYRGSSYEKRGGGLSPYCKSCMRARNKRRTPEQKARYQEQQRRHHALHYQKHSERIKRNTANRTARLKRDDPANYRAQKFFDAHRVDVAADVTREYLADLFRRITHCQCCGKTMRLQYELRESRRFRSNPDAPSIDRVNNRKGYTRLNIAVICWRCNFRKTDLALEDLEMLSLYIKRFGEF